MSRIFSGARAARPLLLAVVAALLMFPAVAAAGSGAPQGDRGLVVELGDVSGDGLPDFGGQIDVGGVSRFAVAFGSPGDGPAAWPTRGGQGLLIDASAVPQDPSRQLIRIGDFDGDGYDDFALLSGAPASYVIYGAAQTGTVALASGGGPRVSVLRHPGLRSEDGYGVADFTGDGRDDILHVRDAKSQPTTGAVVYGSAMLVHGRSGRPGAIEIGSPGAGLTLIAGDQTCGWRWIVALPSYTCVTMLKAAPDGLGDYDRDGYADLYQPAGGFVIRGRASNATILGNRRGALTLDVPARPPGGPWTSAPGPTPTPTPTPGPATPTPTPTPGPATPTPTPTPGGGLAEWALSGSALRLADGSVNVAPGSAANQAGGVFDTARALDARNVTVEFDVRLTAVAGTGHGLAVAFADRAAGGQPVARNAGIGLGWVGNRGAAVLLGTVKGGLTPSNNYLAVASDVVGRSGYPTLLATGAPGTTLAGSTTRVKVVSSAGTVTVFINGTERLRHGITLPANAYLGFTAATSALRQDHVVSGVSVSGGVPAG